MFIVFYLSLLGSLSINLYPLTRDVHSIFRENLVDSSNHPTGVSIGDIYVLKKILPLFYLNSQLLVSQYYLDSTNDGLLKGR